MAIISLVLLAGTKAPIFCSVASSAGTLAVASPTLTLYARGSSTPVTGFSAVACSNSAPGATVQVWYDVDTASLAAGGYWGVFSVPVTASADANARTEKIDLRLYIRGPG